MFFSANGDGSFAVHTLTDGERDYWFAHGQAGQDMAYMNSNDLDKAIDISKRQLLRKYVPYEAKQ